MTLGKTSEIENFRSTPFIKSAFFRLSRDAQEFSRYEREKIGRFQSFLVVVPSEVDNSQYFCNGPKSKSHDASKQNNFEGFFSSLDSRHIQLSLYFSESGISIRQISASLLGKYSEWSGCGAIHQKVSLQNALVTFAVCGLALSGCMANLLSPLFSFHAEQRNNLGENISDIVGGREHLSFWRGINNWESMGIPNER